METDSQKSRNRRALSTLLLKDFAHRLCARDLPFRNALGEAPVLVVLTEDTCSDVNAWVDDTQGANIFTVHDGVVKLVVFDPTKRFDAAEEPSVIIPVHAEAHIGTLLDWLSRNPGQKANVSISASGGVLPVEQPRALAST